MENLEEQSMELEALESIFMDDFVRISDVCCRIFVQPFSSSDSDEISYVTAEFTFTYPVEYPSVIPDITIGNTKGLSEAKKLVLIDIATKTAEECIGSAMIYNIVEALKAWMIENNVELLSEHEMVVRRKLERSEMKTSELAGDESNEEEYDAITDVFETQAIQHGTMVTIENFAQWKKEFDERIKEKWRIEDEENLDPDAAKRITGKQYFETNASSGGFLAAIELECEKQQGAASDNAESHGSDFDDN